MDADSPNDQLSVGFHDVVGLAIENIDGVPLSGQPVISIQQPSQLEGYLSRVYTPVEHRLLS